MLGARLSASFDANNGLKKKMKETRMNDRILEHIDGMKKMILLPLGLRDRTVAELVEEHKSNGAIKISSDVDASKNNGVIDKEQILLDTKDMSEFQIVCYLGEISKYRYDPDLYDFAEMLRNIDY